MTQPQTERLKAIAAYVVNAAIACGLIVSIGAAIFESYLKLLFWAPRNYAPFWMQAIPWLIILAAPLAVSLAFKARRAVLPVVAIQIALLLYPTVIPISLTWTSSNPWRFTP